MHRENAEEEVLKAMIMNYEYGLTELQSEQV